MTIDEPVKRLIPQGIRGLSFQQVLPILRGLTVPRILLQCYAQGELKLSPQAKQALYMQRCLHLYFFYKGIRSMRRQMYVKTEVIVLGLVCVIAAMPSASEAQTTMRVSVATGDGQGNGDSGFAALNGDRKADLVWHRRSNGATMVWQMTAATLRGPITFPGGMPLVWEL